MKPFNKRISVNEAESNKNNDPFKKTEFQKSNKKHGKYQNEKLQKLLNRKREELLEQISANSGSVAYTREERKTQTFSQLAQQNSQFKMDKNCIKPPKIYTPSKFYAR